MPNVFQRWLHSRRRKTITGTEIDLAPKGAAANLHLYETAYIRCRFKHTTASPFLLGNCHFEDCDFEIGKTAPPGFTGSATFQGCTFTFAKASKLQFNHGQTFDRCIFRGQLDDSVFWTDPNGAERKSGDVSNCDFQDLDFDLIDFRGRKKLDNLKFADWPVVSFQSPEDTAHDYDPDQLPLNLRTLLRRRRFENVLIADLNRWLTDPEDLWAVAHDAPFLDFNGKADKGLPDTKTSERLRQRNRLINQTDKKYRSIFAMLCGRRCYISKAIRTGDDLVLSIIDKDEVATNTSGTFKLHLADCTISEFREGPFDGSLPRFEKPFHLNGYEIDHEHNAVEIKGSRKSMGRLRLSFRKATGQPQ